MTDRTVGESFDGNIVGLQQLQPFFDWKSRRIHLEDVFGLAESLLWVAVAFKTPRHGHAFGFPHQRHLIDSAMTFHTANTLLDVNTVVEVRVIG